MPQMISKPDALPKYLEVSAMLSRDIAAGHLLDGDRLPPEREMAERLGTAVGTLRRALGDLERQGLLERKQGSGNYVRARPDLPSVYAFFRVELLAGGGVPSAELLDVRQLPKPAGLPVFGRSRHAHRMRRLRMLDGIPAVAEEIWLDASYAEPLTDPPQALYQYYREALGLWITRAEDRLSTDRVPDWVPGRFGLASGTPTLMAERTSFASDGVAAEISHSWVNTDVARYVARLR